MRKLFFVGMLLASLFCGASAVLAKEDGTEECDAVALERVLAQARDVMANAVVNTEFLTEIKPTLSDVKKIVEEITAENFRRQEEFFAEEKSK